MCPVCRQSWPGRLSVDHMLHDRFVLDRNSDGEGETTHLFMSHLALGTEWGGSLLVFLFPHPTQWVPMDRAQECTVDPTRSEHPAGTAWESLGKRWHAVNSVSPGLTVGSS